MRYGADVQDLVVLAESFGRAADQLDRTVTTLREMARRIEWAGADAESFEHELQHRLGPGLTRNAAALRDASQAVRRNADEQRSASAAGSGSTGAAAALVGAGAVAGTNRTAGPSQRIPRGAHASTSDYVHELTSLDEGQILLRQVSDGPPPRYVVLLRGMDFWGDGVNAPGVVATDFVGLYSAYQADVRQALTQLPADAEIGIIGHSQGGMAAIEVAEGDARVKDLMILGSPIDHKVIPSTVQRSIAFENQVDAVPHLDGGSLNPFDRAGIMKAHFSTGTLNPGAAHSVRDSYLRAIEAAEGGSHGVAFTQPGEAGYARSFVRAFERRYGGGAGSGSAYLVGI